MDSLSPNLFVVDILATIDFYRQLGFNITMSVPGESESVPVWAMMTNGKVTFMFQTFESLADSLPAVSREGGGSLLFYIRINKIRDYFENIRDKVTIVHGLQKTFYGATEFSIVDNNDFVLTFAEDEVG
jgi:uncharacterized glyoxalase superfamily protein PhnB